MTTPAGATGATGAKPGSIGQKRHLAIFRAGNNSLHHHMVGGIADRNFDYALSWFGSGHPADRGLAEGAAFVHLQKGAKWPGLAETLRLHAAKIQGYDYIWLPDDDLLATPETVERLFTVCSQMRLELAQPALTRDSHWTHLITLQHAAFRCRYTNFVEIMAPVLSRAMLNRIHHTLDGQISGFGLDSLWPRFSQLGKVAVVDETTVRHTRPVGGPNYAFSAAAGVPPLEEDALVSCAGFVETSTEYHLNFGGVLQDGSGICIGSSGERLAAVLQAVQASNADLPPGAALKLARYVASHVNYWAAGEQGQARYSRDLVRVVLNRALGHNGIRFD